MNLYKYCSYKKQLGIASYITMGMVAILLFSSIFIAVLVISNQTLGTTDDQQIVTAIVAVGEQKDAAFSNVQVIQKNDTHARGRLTDARDEKQKNFFAQKIGGTWQVVSVVDTSPSCELYIALGFTSAFIDDCERTYPNAVAVEEAKEVLRTAVKPTFLEVLARVTSVEKVTKFVATIIKGDTPQSDTTAVGTENSSELTEQTVTVVTLTSDEGEEIVVEINEDEDEDVEVGDTIIIGAIVAPNQSTGSDSSDNSSSGSSQSSSDTSEEKSTVTVTDVVNVSDEAENIEQVEDVVEEVETTTGTTETATDDDSTNQNSGVYEFNVGIENYGELENVFDIDNSDVNIKIEG